MPTTLITRLGFRADPFEKTDADQEPYLAEYFVKPPYFEQVCGDPEQPRPSIVFASRGSGKTALRVMVERRSRDGSPFLCITYDEFDPVPLGDVDLAYHIHQISRSVLVGILAELDQRPDATASFSRAQKDQVIRYADMLLGKLSAEDFHRAIAAVKSLGDKAGDFMRRYSGPVQVVVALILQKLGLTMPAASAIAHGTTKRDDSPRYHLGQLVSLAQAIGFSSVYILVDRVDETSMVANDPDRAFDFIAPLILDLPTLETAGVGFKLFLWDRLYSRFLEHGGRSDRINVWRLAWRVDELRSMLQGRLAAYTAPELLPITSLNKLLCAGHLDLQGLVCRLAARPGNERRGG